MIPVIYAFSGGMRASIITDVAQSVTVVAFLIGLLAVLGSSNPASFGTWNGYGESWYAVHGEHSGYCLLCLHQRPQ